MAPVQPPTPGGEDWKTWALQLIDFLQNRDASQTAVPPRPVLLEHQRGDDKAVTAGVLMYNPTLEAVVVADGAQWVTQYNGQMPVGEGIGMHWNGAWTVGEYDAGSVVTDWPYAMIANKDTQDRPAPQPVGPPFDLYTGANPTTPIVAKVLLFGTEYTNTDTWFYLLEYRVWTVIGNDYRVYSETGGVITELLSFVAALAGWQEFTISTILVSPGTTFTLFVQVTEPNPTPVTVTLPYDYQTPQNATTPAAGAATQATREVQIIRFNVIDADVVDRSVELLAANVGDTLKGPGGVSWIIQSITDEAPDPSVAYGVVPAVQGSPTGLFDFLLETAVATPITVINDIDYWLAEPNIRSFYSLDSAPSVITQAAYGIDIKVQNVTASDDWDVIAVSGSVASGDGGGAGGAATNSLNDLYYESPVLPAPILVNEGGPPTTLTTLTVDKVVSGRYRISVGLVVGFLAVNDKLHWRAVGTLPTLSDFIMKSNAADERVPSYYSMTVTLPSGPFSTTIEAEVFGPGMSEVSVDTADIYMVRL